MSSQHDIKKAIKLEYAKCLQDPAYFMEKYCKIQHPSKGTIPFKPFDFQKDCLRQFKNNPKNIILKCRQMGISTLTAGYSLWLMTFFKDKSILVIATKQDVAKNMITKVRFMNDSLPSWLRRGETENNRTSLKLSNGSFIKAVSASGDAGRSEALSLLIMDEAAFIDRAREIWTAVQPAMTHGGGNAIILSTPNGFGNFFHEKWIEAEQGVGDFKINAIKLHWTLHPEYDQQWRDKQEAELGPRQAAQECDCSFITSGNSVVDTTILEWFKEIHVQDPISKEYVDQGYWKWKLPDYTKEYIVSADVARGDGEDYSAFHVLELESMEQVAEYKGKLETEQFGNFLVQVATEWNDALLIVENSNIGWAVIQQVINREYKNLFYMTEDMKYVDPDAPTSNKINSLEKKKTAGFTTSAKTRPLIISKLELCCRDKSVVLHSIRVVSELYTFIWKNGKAQAADGYNDDLTMALAIGLWVYDTAMMMRSQGIELQRKALMGIGKNKYQPNGIFIPTRFSAHIRHDPYEMKVGHTGQTEDLRWLIK